MKNLFHHAVLAVEIVFTTFAVSFHNYRHYHIDKTSINIFKKHYQANYSVEKKIDDE